MVEVVLIEEYRGHINPERRRHFYDPEMNKEPVANMRAVDINRMARCFGLKIVKVEKR